MKRFTVAKLLMLSACAGFVFSLPACSTTAGGVEAGVYVGDEPYARGGPPPHAPAHGHRAKHTYRYYPDTAVYFDISRQLYFYLDGGDWSVSASLPSDLQVHIGDYVVIGSDSATPYVYADKHKAKYPPGKGKKKEKKKGKKW